MSAWPPETGSNDAILLMGHSSLVSGVCVSPSGELVASAAADPAVFVWRGGRLVQSMWGHSVAVMSVAFSPDGQQLVSGSADNTARVWDVESGENLGLLAHPNWVTSTAWVAQKIVTGCGDGVVRVWCADSLECQHVLEGHCGWVLSVCFGCDGHHLASAGEYGEVFVWGEARKQICRLRGHTEDVYEVAFAPDSSRIATVSGDHTVKMWSVAGDELWSVDVCFTAWSVSFSASGLALAVGCGEMGFPSCVLVVDASSGGTLTRMDGHKDVVRSVCFAPAGIAGDVVVSGSFDRSVRVWVVPSLVCDTGVPIVVSGRKAASGHPQLPGPPEQAMPIVDQNSDWESDWGAWEEDSATAVQAVIEGDDVVVGPVTQGPSDATEAPSTAGNDTGWEWSDQWQEEPADAAPQLSPDPPPCADLPERQAPPQLIPAPLNPVPAPLASVSNSPVPGQKSDWESDWGAWEQDSATAVQAVIEGDDVVIGPVTQDPSDATEAPSTPGIDTAWEWSDQWQEEPADAAPQLSPDPPPCADLPERQAPPQLIPAPLNPVPAPLASVSDSPVPGQNSDWESDWGAWEQDSATAVQAVIEGDDVVIGPVTQDPSDATEAPSTPGIDTAWEWSDQWQEEPADAAPELSPDPPPCADIPERQAPPQLIPAPEKSVPDVRTLSEDPLDVPKPASPPSPGSDWAFSDEAWKAASSPGVLSPDMYLRSPEVPSTVLRGHRLPVCDVAVSPCGTIAASASSDATVVLWDTASAQVLRCLSGHAKFVKAVAFSPDGTSLVTASADHTALVWDVESGEVVSELKHPKAVLAVTWGLFLVSGCSDHQVRMWDATGFNCVHSLAGHTRSVMCVCIAPDGQRFASGGHDRVVLVWSATKSPPEIQSSLEGHSNDVLDVAFSVDGSRLASVSKDSVHLWTADGDPLWRVVMGSPLRWDAWSSCVELGSPLGWDAWSVAFSPDGRHVAVGIDACCDARRISRKPCPILLHCADTGAEVMQLRGHNAFVTCLVYHPSGSALLSGSWDHTCRIWTLPRMDRQ